MRLLLFGVLIFTTISCKELLDDNNIKSGLSVKSVSEKVHSRNLYFEENDPKWEVTQWHSRTDIINSKARYLRSGKVRWGNPEKFIEMGSKGSLDGDISMGINTNYSYKGRYRKKTDPKDWPHLYLDQRVAPKQDKFLSELKGIRLSFDAKLKYARHIVKKGYDIIEKLNNIQTDENDKPLQECRVIDCGLS